MLEIKKIHSKGKSLGFTLIELMVTLAIIIIIAVIAIPGYADFQRSSELSSRTSTFISAINAARGEAMKRGRYAMLVPTDGADWSTGVLVFVDMNGNQVFNAATDPVIYSNSDAFPSYLTVTSPTGTASGTTPYILFDAQGYAKTKAAAFSNVTISFSRNDVETARIPSQTRRIIILRTGRVRTCTPTSSTDTTCQAGSSN